MSHLFRKLKSKHQDQINSQGIDLSYTLYFYLKQIDLQKAKETSDQKLLLDFIFLCLSLNYWRQRQKDFFYQIKRLLRSLQDILEAQFCQRLCRLQICPIDSQRSLYEIVQRQVKKSCGSDDKLRILPDGKANVICLILSSDRVLSVRSYLPYGVIYDGQILPLSDGTRVEYSPELDLVPGQLHILKKDQNDFYVIKKAKEAFFITSLSGVTFIPYSFDQVKMLEKHLPVYYHLKRLEQFFIDRSTDPYYRNLVHLLEAQIQYLSKDASMECIQESIKVYEKIWSVFDKIFCDDKLLFLLLRQLNDKIDQVRILNDTRCTKKNKIKSPLNPEWGM